MLKLNRARETSITTGTGNFTLAGAAVGFLTLYVSSGSILNSTFSYCIQNITTGEFELGRGHLSASNILVRDTVIVSSNNNQLVSFIAGTKDVFGTLLAGDLDDLADKAYVHIQNSASTLWSVAHNLNKRPSVMVVDSAGSVVYGDVNYVDDNNITITFSAAFSGKAYLN